MPYDDELRSDLIMYLGKRRAGPLFISNKGNPISVRAINDLVARAAAKTNVTHPNPRRRWVNPHPFRHAFAREWSRNGGHLESLSKILGHSSVATTIDLHGTKSVADLQEDYARVMESP